MEIRAKFKNITSYNLEMTKSLEDKLFFVEKFPKTENYIFVDFGCADGTMLRALHKIYRSGLCHFIGYDISTTMIEFASHSLSTNEQEIRFYDNWDILYNYVTSLKDITCKVVLICSSVIHEVYSYGNENSIDKFWNILNDNIFDYVVVRDMMVSKELCKIPFKEKIKAVPYRPNLKNIKFYISEFESEWGKINNICRLIHFLLKYRWTQNWNREIKENYLPICTEYFLGKMQLKHNISYLELFKVPFLEQCWKDDFGIIIEYPTHIKAIFKHV